MNRQQLLSRLGKKHEVVYSQGAASIWQARSNSMPNGPIFGSTSVHDNVRQVQMPKWLLRWPSKRRYDSTVLRLHCRRLDKLIGGPRHSSPRVLYVFHPAFADYVEYVSHDILVYHPYDLFSETPGWDETAEHAQLSLMRSADIVFASSTPIADKLRQLEQRDIHVLPNGVDFTAFDAMKKDRYREPVDIAQIPRPRLGYVGRVTQKVDIDLLLTLATLKSDWQILLIGPVGMITTEQTLALQHLARLPNCHLLGEKPRAQLPEYYYALDVGLLSYRVDGTWARFGYPLKLHEFFASGKPVVSADLLAVREFERYLTIAKSPREWQSAVEKVLRTDSKDLALKRIQIARNNSWDILAERLESHLIEYIDLQTLDSGCR